MRRPRVVYWNNIPSPYVVERFNAVVRRGSLDFEAWFCARLEPDRSWTVDEASFEFPYRYLPGRAFGLPRLGRRHWNLPVAVLERPAPDLLISIYAEPTFIAGWWMARQRGIRTAFRYLPTYDAWIARTPEKERLKRYLFARAEGFKTGGPAGRERLLGYGVPPGRIHVVTQSIDVARLRDGAARWRPERSAIRAELGLDGVVFLAVGRLWMGKGLQHLLRAYADLTAPGDVQASLLLVGDGPDEAALRAMVAELRLPRVVFAGFVQQADLPRYHVAADVLVFPTLGDPNGLVVEEALAAGLPVIASESAGDIRARLLDGAAGILVPPADAASLAGAMRRLAADPEARRRLAAAGAVAVVRRSHDNYAQDFEAFVGRTLAMPKIR